MKGEIADFSLKRLFRGARRPQTGVLGFPARMIVKEGEARAKETNSKKKKLTVKNWAPCVSAAVQPGAEPNNDALQSTELSTSAL